MKKIKLLLLLLLVSCSKPEDNSLILVCNGFEESNSIIYSMTTIENKKSSSRTYKLNNKSWNNELCTEWSTETILCENDKKLNEGSTEHFIRIDRISGIIKENNIFKGKNSINFNRFEGKCEKKDSPKF